ncbi:diacylglycerol kinase [Schaalia georgiae]|nr:diacylglycerol kinase [Schaalia georgiae]
MSIPKWLVAAVLGAGAVGAGRAAVALARRARRRSALSVPSPPADPAEGLLRPWIIMNPSKHEDPAAFRALVDRAAMGLGAGPPHWLETTREDPGAGQAVEAVSRGAAVVIAAGGDGTVRAVAAGMAGSGVRMGILPVGTGNVLAGNLGLPDDPAAAMAVALGEYHRNVDLTWVRLDGVEEASPLPAEGGLVLAAHAARPPQPEPAPLSGSPGHAIEPDGPGRPSKADPAPGPGDGAPVPAPDGTAPGPDGAAPLPAPDEYACAVVAGMGFDGQTMAGTHAALKKQFGWIAYVLAGLGAIGAPRLRAQLTLRSPEARESAPIDPGDSLVGTPRGDDEVTRVEARSVMFANCGELKFVLLAPDANLSDGLIDVIAVDAQAGLLGWADVTWKFLGQLVGLRPLNLPVSTGTVAFRQARGASVAAQTAQAVQVDGDALGTARTMRVRIQPDALDVAVPAERTWMELLPG